MSGGKTGDSVAAPVEAELERSEQLHAKLKARIEELRDDAENAEARQLRELEPKLAAHNGELRNTIAVLRLIEHQIALEHYVRIDGYAPLITRILGFVAMAEERSRQEMMATFTERGEKRYTIEDAVMQLCRRGLLKRTDVGKVEAVQERAWEAIERGESGLTHRILTMIEAGGGPCSRRDILAHFSGEGFAKGAIDSSLQRLRQQRRVSTRPTGRTTTYSVTTPTVVPQFDSSNRDEARPAG